jgi:uncharacterized protein (DUF924 family)
MLFYTARYLKCSDINLLELLNYWYLSDQCISNNLTSLDFCNIWLNKWFCKGNKQKIIDDYLKKYDNMIDKYVSYEPKNLFETIGIIILYDQITRNIYRKTAKAYLYDNIALKYAKLLLNDFDNLFFGFQLTITLCLIHSENINDLYIAKQLITKIKNNKYCDYRLYNSLRSIFNNHYDRILLFGRIPERNKFLHRISTHNETVYLNNI